MTTGCKRTMPRALALALLLALGAGLLPLTAAPALAQVEGRIVDDGPKEAVLTEENLFRTYDTEVRISRVDGYYLAYPPDGG